MLDPKQKPCNTGSVDVISIEDDKADVVIVAVRISCKLKYFD